MSLLVNSKETQIAELERQIKIKREQAEKALSRQKILLGAFFLDILENDKLEGAREYTVGNLDKYLTRSSDKELLAPVIENLNKLIKGLSLGEEVKKEVTPIQNNNHV